MEDKSINIILSYVDDHIFENIKLLTLAQLTGYSPFYLSKMFSETVGVSITYYIRVRKLQYSITHLLKGEKVIDVALKFGFESHEGYTRSFSKLFGSTPKTIKKHMQFYVVPKLADLKIIQKGDNNMQSYNISNDLHAVLYTFLNESIEEAKAGYCTRIDIRIGAKNEVFISDNGRGIPLSDDGKKNYDTLNNIFSGQPFTKLDFDNLVDHTKLNLQTISSLCEKLKVTVYRDNICYIQDFLKGVAQHEVIISKLNEEKSGVELNFLPDKDIFGESLFQKEKVEKWVSDKLQNNKSIKVNIIND